MNAVSYSTTASTFSITPRAGFCAGAWVSDDYEDKCTEMELDTPIHRQRNTNPNNIRAIREAQELTQAICCKRAKMPSSRWSLIERGQRPGKRTARRMAKALNATPSEVFPNYEQLRHW